MMIKNFLQNGVSACDSLINQNFENKSTKVFHHVNRKISWILKEWLTESRNIWKSEILQYFQNLTLGSEIFQEITGLDWILKSEPYLVKYDNPLVNDEIRNKIIRLHSEKNIFPSVITARPSSFSNSKISEKSHLYYPEAELALKCLQLEQIPCVGYGALEYLGKEKNSSGDQFVKPSPVHAMTAILLSSGLDINDALKWSYDYFYNNRHKEIVDYLSRFPAPINMCIFEDSTIGIQSLETVSKNLINDGLTIDMLVYGIAKNKNKIDALMNENAFIFPTINEAFSACVDFLKI
ncbi:MAG: hypothetical protein K0B14_15355 [Anaerolineaceae bacterium]|nr:hypothetical protein [Anaerolineaceae bacterium]